MHKNNKQMTIPAANLLRLWLLQPITYLDERVERIDAAIPEVSSHLEVQLVNAHLQAYLARAEKLPEPTVIVRNAGTDLRPARLSGLAVQRDGHLGRWFSTARIKNMGRQVRHDDCSTLTQLTMLTVV